MKIRIEADSATELHEKGDAFLGQLAKALAASAPDVADALEKARTKLPAKETELKHQALRDVAEQMHSRYQMMLDEMLGEIGRVLDDHVVGLAKSEDPDYTRSIVQREQAGLDRVQGMLALHGFTDADYLENGKLYGLSLDELRGLVNELTTKAG